MTLILSHNRPDTDLALLAEEVYGPPLGIAAAVGERWTLHRFFDRGAAQAALFRSVHHPRWALVFRGTQVSSGFSLRDIGANFGVPESWAGPGRVHSGYNGQLRMVRDEARWELCEQVPNDEELWVAGHSMGGALSVVFAAWALSATGLRIRGLVTFGAPKSLTDEAIRLTPWPNDVRQYEVRGDFAPYWPPSFRVRNPGPFVAIPSTRWYYGPVRRHAPGVYSEQVRRYNEGTL